MPSFDAVVGISKVMLTWYRVVVWALTNGLAALNDVLEDAVAEAHAFRTLQVPTAAARGHRDGGGGGGGVGEGNGVVALVKAQQGSAQRIGGGSGSRETVQEAAEAEDEEEEEDEDEATDAAPLLSRWRDMLTWAEAEPVLGMSLDRTLLQELDRCWESLRGVVGRVAAAEQSAAALLPRQRAAAALTPPRTAAATGARKGSGVARGRNRPRQPSGRQRQGPSMSASDIAGLAHDFSVRACVRAWRSSSDELV